MLIDEVLLRRRLVDQGQPDLAREQSDGRRVDRVLVDFGLVGEEDFFKVLANELGLQYVDAHELQVDRALLAEFPAGAVFRHTLLPFGRQDGRVLVAASDPFDLEGIDELGSLSGYELEVVLARRADIVELIRDNLGVGGDTIDELVSQCALDYSHDPSQDLHNADELTELALTASVVRLVNELLREALRQHASDIHVEPQMSDLTIRYRIDGMLWVQPVPAEIRQSPSNRRPARRPTRRPRTSRGHCQCNCGTPAGVANAATPVTSAAAQSSNC